MVRLAWGAMALMVLAVVAVAFLAWQSRSQGGGQLAFTRESVDLGRVPIGQAAPFRFEMRNVGNTPVKIISKPKIAALEGC